MTNSQRLAAVRARFLRWIGESAPATEAPDSSPGESVTGSILRETILVRDDFFVGRRFHTHRFDAVWFIEEDRLKIYRRGGELLCVLESADIDTSVSDSKTEAVGPVILKLPTPATSPATAHDGDAARRAA